MNSSWNIGRVRGIEIRIHFTLLILLGWVAVSHYLERQRWDDALSGFVFVAALFGVVVLHELGHALMAQRFGIRTLDITLLPIGGLARLERIPEKPQQELLVALAGPAVNVVLATVLYALLWAGGGSRSIVGIAAIGGQIPLKLMWANVTLAVFNMIPAFPMDGGRVLRAVLATQMDYVRATNIAAQVGKGMAWIFGLVGLLINPFLVFIGVFIWIGAAAEAGMVQMKFALTGIPVERVMLTEFRTLAPDEPLSRAVEHILSGCQQDFPVAEGGRVVGVLTRAKLLFGLAHGGTEAPVREFMQRNVCTAAPTEPLEKVIDRLRGEESRVLPVVRDGELAGMLTAENLGEYLMIQNALDESKQLRPGGGSVFPTWHRQSWLA